jgi:hypothetical protein
MSVRVQRFSSSMSAMCRPTKAGDGHRSSASLLENSLICSACDSMDAAIFYVILASHL